MTTFYHVGISTGWRNTSTFSSIQEAFHVLLGWVKNESDTQVHIDCVISESETSLLVGSPSGRTTKEMEDYTNANKKESVTRPEHNQIIPICESDRLRSSVLLLFNFIHHP